MPNDENLNQPPPLVDYNLFATDRALCGAVTRENAGWACGQLEEYGRKLGSAEVTQCGALANEYPPVLRTHDRFGNRRDEVEFHPAWHDLTAGGHRTYPQFALGGISCGRARRTPEEMGSIHAST